MDLYETLSLAKSVGVELELVCGRLKVTPKENVTEELITSIRENLDALREHLSVAKREVVYKLLTDIATAGITLRLKEGDKLYASPTEAVLSHGLRDRIAQYRDVLITMIKVREAEVECEAEVTLLARDRFDTKPHEHSPTKEEAWTNADKAEFFKGKEYVK